MAEAATALSALALKTGDTAQATELAERAREAAPNTAAPYLAKANALLAEGDSPEFEAALREALERDPFSLPVQSRLLSLEIKQGNARTALPRITTLIAQYPRNAGFRLLLGLAWFSLRDLDKSEAAVKQALQLDPAIPDAETLLANIASGRGLPQEAKAHLRTAIAANPRSLVNYIALVTEYEKEGNWREAKEVCEKAHDIDPGSPMVAAELAFLYLEHGGDVNAAVSLAQMARQKLPESPVTADALGWAYYKLGSTGSAITQLKEAAAKAPGNPIYRYHLGMAYLAAGRPELAGQSLHAALAADPQFPDAARARAALETLSSKSFLN
jgi:tetratricopeptide (TPR) repeat protein